MFIYTCQPDVDWLLSGKEERVEEGIFPCGFDTYHSTQEHSNIRQFTHEELLCAQGLFEMPTRKSPPPGKLVELRPKSQSEGHPPQPTHYQHSHPPQNLSSHVSGVPLASELGYAGIGPSSTVRLSSFLMTSVFNQG